ncbi:hypothetical protein [Microbacterium arborescens]|uniref:hypothetical protein n=1 Tax=Microbacterium arborescens TaxID=33883 RepID=UPI00278A85CC|nr:hypothetical protein [Microbacterium arborescens]MDQ1215385.1 hypothetical protein [Microbacterium arborescens]
MGENGRIPESFDEARDRLRLRLHSVDELGILQADLDRRRALTAFPAVSPDTGLDLVLGVALDMGEGVVDVTDEVLSVRWGVDHVTAVRAARENVAGRQFSGISRVTEALFLLRDEEFIAAAVLDPGMLDSFSVNGELLLLPLAKDVALLTGTSDISGMLSAAELANRALAAGADPLSASPLVRDDVAWVPYTWPDAIAGHGIVGELERRYRTIMYERQAAVIETEGHHLAEAQFVRRPDGLPWTVATWSMGQDTLLPVVDELLAVAGNGTVTPLDFASFLRSFSHRIVIEFQHPKLFLVPADLGETSLT